MIEVLNISKSFGLLEAVRNVSFTVEKGEILGFLGPNGAGKTTTMRMITGFLPPSAGTAKVCGFDIREKPVDAKKLIGYLPENAPSYADMTAQNFLRFAAAMRGFTGAEMQKKVDAAVELCRLDGVRHQAVGTLSKGFRQRVCFAQAVLHDPPVLIMDEPTDGLDPNQKHVVRTMIREMAEEKTIIVSTHILEEVDAICTQAVIISDGALVAKGSPEDLRSRGKSHGAVEMVVQGSSDDIADELGRLPSAESVEVEGNCYTVYPKNAGELLPEVTGLIKGKAWQPTGLRVLDGRLEDVFKQLTIGDDLSKVG